MTEMALAIAIGVVGGLVGSAVVIYSFIRIHSWVTETFNSTFPEYYCSECQTHRRFHFVVGKGWICLWGHRRN